MAMKWKDEQERDNFYLTHTFCEIRLLEIEGILNYMEQVQLKYEKGEMLLEDYVIRMGVIHDHIQDKVDQGKEFMEKEREAHDKGLV